MVLSCEEQTNCIWVTQNLLEPLDYKCALYVIWDSSLNQNCVIVLYCAAMDD